MASLVYYTFKLLFKFKFYAKSKSSFINPGPKVEPRLNSIFPFENFKFATLASKSNYVES